MPPLLVKVPLPALALLANTMVSWLPTKCCVTPELFVTPWPLMFNVNEELTVMVNALAPALKTIPFTSVSPESETAVRLLVANVAVSEGAFGMTCGVQFAAVFQSPEPGLARSRSRLRQCYEHRAMTTRSRR